MAVIVTAAGMIMLLAAPFGSERLFTVFQFRGLYPVSYSKPRLASVPRLTVCNLSMYPICPLMKYTAVNHAKNPSISIKVYVP